MACVFFGGCGYFARWAQYASRLRLFRPLGSIRLRGYGYFARWAQYASAAAAISPVGLNTPPRLRLFRPLGSIRLRGVPHPLPPPHGAGMGANCA